MKTFLLKRKLERDEIISYQELVHAEDENLQRGMNYNPKKEYSVVLMSIRKNAPYSDEIDTETNSIVYEGHDVMKKYSLTPKVVDQPLTTPKGTLTENGKFFVAASSYKMKIMKNPRRVKVYEKIKDGIWCYKGFFNLTDARIVNVGHRNVFKFYLQPVDINIVNQVVNYPQTRLIPTNIKVEVWARDKGQCIKCGSKENLHYDHDLPFSKGGTSYVAENVRILCATCNLKKGNKILTIPPFLFA